jgi:hypothetical protein
MAQNFTPTHPDEDAATIERAITTIEHTELYHAPTIIHACALHCLAARVDIRKHIPVQGGKLAEVINCSEELQKYHLIRKTNSLHLQPCDVKRAANKITCRMHCATNEITAST